MSGFGSGTGQTDREHGFAYSRWSNEQHVVAGFGYRWAFWINAASYLVSAVVLRQLRVLAIMARPSGRTSWLADVRNGLTVLVGHRLLRALAAGQFLAALSAGPLAPCSSSLPASTSACRRGRLNSGDPRG